MKISFKKREREESGKSEFQYYIKIYPELSSFLAAAKMKKTRQQ